MRAIVVDSNTAYRACFEHSGPRKQNAFATLVCLGNLGGDTTPQQESLLGVIICPPILQFFGWAAVKGELLHRNITFLRCCQQTCQYRQRLEHGTLPGSWKS
jgi:hypothetical protein